MLRLSRSELLSGNIYRCLIRIAIPLVFLSLINTLYGVVDTYFVSLIGELEVGAISLVSPVISCGSAFSEGLCAATIALISIAVGENNIGKTKKLANNMLSLCIILGILFCIILTVFCRPVLAYLNTPKEIYDASYRYLFGIAFDFVPLFVISVYQAIMQGHGDSRSGVVINTIAAVANCVLDPLFIQVFHMGTLGAALATVLSKCLVLPIIFIRLKKDGITDSSLFRFDFAIFKEAVVMAVPCSIGSFLSSFGFVLMSKEIANYGPLAVSAYGVGSRLSGFYYIFVYCWGTALTTLIGAALGAKNKERCKACYKAAMVMVTFVSLIFIPLGLLTSRFLIRLLIKNISDELLAMSLEYAYYSIFTAFCMGWMTNLTAVFNGSGNTLISMILNGSRIWFIRIPIIKLLNRMTDLGVTNIWIAMCVSNVIVCIIGTFFYHFYHWDRKKLQYKKTLSTV